MTALTPSEVEAVAAKLTKAQRRVFEIIYAADRQSGCDTTNLHEGVLAILRHKGLSSFRRTWNGPREFRTDLGLAVRDYLKDHPNVD